MNRSAAYLLGWLLLLTMPALAQPLPDADLVAALRGGGHVIVFRHGATHSDQADTDPLNLDNVAKQRHLNDKGRAAARGWGEAFKAMGIPVGAIYSSRFFRAQETAKLAFGEPTPLVDVSEGGQVVSPIENNRRTEALRKLVAVAPAAGRNTVIVSHKPNIVDAFGKDWFDVREGEATVFRPDGQGGAKAVTRVTGDQWSTLAAKYPR
jgi:broad specificity phosphatase PhoE